jgi:hypothetical protein
MAESEVKGPDRRLPIPSPGVIGEACDSVRSCYAPNPHEAAALFVVVGSY